MNTSNIVMWVTQYNNADYDCFKILILPVTWKTRSQHRAESYAFLEVTCSCQQNWMCKKQTSVSHSSTEVETTSLDAGLRMDGIPALGLWVQKCFIATKTNLVKPRIHQHRETCGIASCRAHETRMKPKLQPSTVVLNCFILIMCLRTSNFLSIAMLYVFEDN